MARHATEKVNHRQRRRKPRQTTSSSSIKGIGDLPTYREELCQHPDFPARVDMDNREGPEHGRDPAEIIHTRPPINYFRRAGLAQGRDYHYLGIAGGKHNERHWTERFDDLHICFFGRNVEPLRSTASTDRDWQ